MRTFDLSSLVIDCGNVVFIHGLTITEIAYTNALQENLTSLLFCQIFCGAELLQLMAKTNEKVYVIYLVI